jgi:transcriptional regulator NrdR family protein
MGVQYVVKRDNTVQPFAIQKIEDAVYKAMQSVGIGTQ